MLVGGVNGTSIIVRKLESKSNFERKVDYKDDIYQIRVIDSQNFDKETMTTTETGSHGFIYGAIVYAEKGNSAGIMEIVFRLRNALQALGPRGSVAHAVMNEVMGERSETEEHKGIYLWASNLKDYENIQPIFINERFGSMVYTDR